MATTEQLIRGYMAIDAEFCETATELAESTADHFGAWHWLDDETHVVWELALEYIPGD